MTTATVTRTRVHPPRAALLILALPAAALVAEVAGWIGLVSAHHGALPIPLPVLVQALVQGCESAMMVLGLVLIYRATRIINFAHVSLGAVGAALFAELSFRHFPWWAAAPLGVVAAGLLGFIVELLLVRRFARSPRLVVTVVTIGAAQLLAAVALLMPRWFGDDRQQALPPTSPVTHWRWHLAPVVLTGDGLLLALGAAVLFGGVALLLRRSSIGIAIRAAAENDDRALLLGINTGALSSVVWTLAATAAGLAAVLQLPTTLPGGGGVALSAGQSVGGVGLLLPALAAAVLADMEDLPTAVVAAFAIAVLQVGFYFAFATTAVFNVGLLVLVVAGLLLRRRRLSRIDPEAASSWAASDELLPVPAELLALPSVRSGVRRAWGAAAVVALAFPWVMSPSQTSTGSLFVIDGIIVVSLVVLTGWTGQISLGQFGFVAIGAAVSGALTTKVGLPFPVALAAGCLVGAGSAVVVGLPALRVRGLFLALSTLVFAVVVWQVVLSHQWFGWLLPSEVNRPRFLWIRFEDERAYYYLCLLALAFTVAVVTGLRRSRTGRVLIAMRDNERAVQSFGVDVVRARLVSFAVSGFLAALAGVLYAAHQHSVTQAAFTPDQGIDVFLMAVIGGLGSVPGSLLGAAYLGALNLAVTSPGWRLAGSSVVVLLILVLFPGGLGAMAYKARDAVLRRVAIRRRVYVPSLLGDHPGWGRGALVPIAPLPAGDGAAPRVPEVYRRRSRIATAGTSQTGGRWTYS